MAQEAEDVAGRDALPAATMVSVGHTDGALLDQEGWTGPAVLKRASTTSWSVAYTSTLSLTDAYGYAYTSPVAVVYGSVATGAAVMAASATGGSNAVLAPGSSSSNMMAAPPPQHISAYIGMCVLGIFVFLIGLAVVALSIYRRGMRDLERKAADLQAGIDDLDRRSRKQYRQHAPHGSATRFASSDETEYSTEKVSFHRASSARLRRWFSGNRDGARARKVQSAPSVVIHGRVEQLVSPYETPVLARGSSQGQGQHTAASAALWSRLPASVSASGGDTGSAKKAALFRYNGRDYRDPSSVSTPGTPRFADVRVDLYDDTPQQSYHGYVPSPTPTFVTLPEQHSHMRHAKPLSSTFRGVTHGHSASPSVFSPSAGAYSPVAWHSAESPLISAPSPALNRASIDQPAQSGWQEQSWQELQTLQSSDAPQGVLVPIEESEPAFADQPSNQLSAIRPPMIRLDSGDETLVDSGSARSIAGPEPLTGLGVNLIDGPASSLSASGLKPPELHREIADPAIPMRLQSSDVLAAISPSSSEDSLSGQTTAVEASGDAHPDIDDEEVPARRFEPAQTAAHQVQSRAGGGLQRRITKQLSKSQTKAVIVTSTRAQILPASSRERYRRTIDAIADMDGLEAIEEALRLITQLLVTPVRPLPRRKRAATLPTQPEAPLAPLRTRPRRGTESNADSAMLHGMRQKLLLEGPTPATTKLARRLTKSRSQVRFLLDTIDKTDDGASSIRSSRTGKSNARPISAASTASAYSVASRPQSLAPRGAPRQWVSSAVPFDAASALQEFFGMEFVADSSSKSLDEREEVLSLASGSDGVRFEAVTLPHEHQSISATNRVPSYVRGLGFHLPQRMSGMPPVRDGPPSNPVTPSRKSASDAQQLFAHAEYAKHAPGLGLFLDDPTTASEEDVSQLPRMLWRQIDADVTGIRPSFSGALHDAAGAAIGQSDSNPRFRSIVSNEADVESWSFFATPATSREGTADERAAGDLSTSPMAQHSHRRLYSPPPGARRSGVKVQVADELPPMHSPASSSFQAHEGMEPLSASASTASVASSPAEADMANVYAQHTVLELGLPKHEPKAKLAKKIRHPSEYTSPTMSVVRFYTNTRRHA